MGFLIEYLVFIVSSVSLVLIMFGLTGGLLNLLKPTGYVLHQPV